MKSLFTALTCWARICPSFANSVDPDQLDFLLFEGTYLHYINDNIAIIQRNCDFFFFFFFFFLRFSFSLAWHITGGAWKTLCCKPDALHTFYVKRTFCSIDMPKAESYNKCVRIFFILPRTHYENTPKTESFQIKIPIFFIFLLKT